MPHSPRDHETILFRSQDLTIRRCSCGIVHLDIGPVSVRLEDEGFHGFAKACHRASAQLAVQRWDGFLNNMAASTEH